GLVNRVVPHDQLMPAVLDLAGTMAKNSPKVLRLAKESIYRSLTSDLDTAFARESEVQAECFYSEDFLEGLTAFTEKRRPEFKGRWNDFSFLFFALVSSGRMQPEHRICDHRRAPGKFAEAAGRRQRGASGASR